MTATTIEWSEKVWNVTRGCRRVSPGCGTSTAGGCYAERTAHRYSGPGLPYEGLVRLTKKGPRWNGRGLFVEDKLEDPLQWRKPARIFVNSMSDLFYEAFSDAQIARVWDVMRRCPQHQFQILTKRPERMRDWVRRLGIVLPNVWLGTSVEDQATADERIPFLCATPARLRWVSAEPLLGPVSITKWLPDACGVASLEDGPVRWVVVGGESGPRSRPCDDEWILELVAECRRGYAACFVKQLGRYPYANEDRRGAWLPTTVWGNPTGDERFDGGIALLKDKKRKGGDVTEWPYDLRWRQYPEAA